MELVYRRAEKKNVQILIDIYNSAFYDDYMKYGECPAFGHTKESMEKNLEKYPKIIAYFQKCSGRRMYHTKIEVTASIISAALA